MQFFLYRIIYLIDDAVVPDDITVSLFFCLQHCVLAFSKVNYAYFSKITI